MAYHFDIPTYDAVVPEAVRSGTVEQVPVIVVGGGLVGLTAAACLGRRGVRVVVLDDDTTVGVRGFASRGVCYANRTLQIFERLGIADRLRAIGLEWETGRVFRDEEELYNFDLVQSPDQVHPPFVNVQQYIVEQYLVEAIAGMPSVEIRWGNAVTGVTQDGAVTVEVETGAGPYRIVADWLIACDGAHSTVRDALGIKVRPNRFEDTWMIVDVHMKRELPRERWVWVENKANGGRAVWFHGMADNVWRVDCQLGDIGETKVKTDDATAREIAATFLKIITGESEVEFDLAWVGPWLYRTQVLDDFRAGHVFFAGDAAHLKSPFGARGGNSGIQDADNLAWKLALVIAGRAPAALLDSYSSERRAAALENIRVTTQTSRFMFPQSEFERLLRTTVLDLSRHLGFGRTLINAGRMSVANVYGAPGDALLSDDLPGGPEALAPGCAGIDIALDAAGQRSALMGRAGDGFAWILFTGAAGLDDPKLRAALKDSVGAAPGTSVTLVAPGPIDDPDFPVLADSGGKAAALWGAAPGTLYLLRPDMHVAWRSAAPAAARVRAAIGAVLGAPMPGEEGPA